ncbi:MAG: hypothetical protein ACKVP4_08145 [Hyphomicrobium sp.]
MGQQSPLSGGSTSFYQDYFEQAFAAADACAFWWQPFMKGIGRSQLELATLQSRNAQSLLNWGRAVATSKSPSDIVTANIGLCQSVAGHISEALPRVSGALANVTHPPAAFELLPLPVKRGRDSLIIPGVDGDRQYAYDKRRVA